MLNLALESKLCLIAHELLFVLMNLDE
jgi:hypothetical protein